MALHLNCSIVSWGTNSRWAQTLLWCNGLLPTSFTDEPHSVLVTVDSLNARGITKTCTWTITMTKKNCLWILFWNFLSLFLCSAVDPRGKRHLLTTQYSLPGIPLALKQSIDLRTSMDGKYKEIAEVLIYVRYIIHCAIPIYCSIHTLHKMCTGFIWLHVAKVMHLEPQEVKNDAPGFVCASYILVCIVQWLFWSI